jgi:hypothetical protein
MQSMSQRGNTSVMDSAISCRGSFQRCLWRWPLTGRCCLRHLSSSPTSTPNLWTSPTRTRLAGPSPHLNMSHSAEDSHPDFLPLLWCSLGLWSKERRLFVAFLGFLGGGRQGEWQNVWSGPKGKALTKLMAEAADVLRHCSNVQAIL